LKDKIDYKFANPVSNITDFYKSIAADPVGTLRQVFCGAVEGTMSKDVSLLAKLLSPLETGIGISAVLHGLMTLNPFEIGLGAAEIGDGLGRYMQLGRAFEKGPPPITPSAPV